MLLRAMEAVCKDRSQQSLWHRAVAALGMCAEFVRPAPIMPGRMTPLAGPRMIGVIRLQTDTLIIADGAVSGARIDGPSDEAGPTLPSRRGQMLLILVARYGGRPLHGCPDRGGCGA
jgi:hypothetical protein